MFDEDELRDILPDEVLEELDAMDASLYDIFPEGMNGPKGWDGYDEMPWNE